MRRAFGSSWSGWSGQVGGLVRAVAVTGGGVSGFMCLSQEESWKEELKEKCGTKVSAYKQVHSERAGLGV